MNRNELGGPLKGPTPPSLEVLAKNCEHFQQTMCEWIDKHKALSDEVSVLRENVVEMVQGVAADVHRLSTWIGAGDAAGPFYAEFVELKTKLEKITVMVESTNRSAPSKRNMTDEDARKVLVGEHKDAKHIDAAEALGLTYAQVYSCRGGFTFKHVIHELEKGGWKNQWEGKIKKQNR